MYGLERPTREFVPIYAIWMALMLVLVESVALASLFLLYRIEGNVLYVLWEMYEESFHRHLLAAAALAVAPAFVHTAAEIRRCSD